MVAQDLFSLDDESYLITVDSFSGFWEVDKLVDTHADTVIQKTKEHFSRHGIPDEVQMDNGPKFSCKAYARFAREWKFFHNTSSPYHPQANGLAES